MMKHVGDLTDPRVAALYANIPRTEWERFQAFCTACPYKQRVTGDVEWSYIANEDGDETLLLLSGALAIPDISWQSIARFAQGYRVIAPAYPAVKTMGALVDGIAEIMCREGVEQAHVLGGSYGGFGTGLCAALPRDDALAGAFTYFAA
jgi:pimeloyl-ACP methyl ester carboxylesterase